jgi:hypothetical protein
VAFWGDPSLRRLVFATPRTTRKFANLREDPRVALLVNSSENAASDFHQAASATVTGTAAPAPEGERPCLAAALLDRHPYLKAFLSAPTTAVVSVAVRKIVLVHHFQTVEELDIEP